MNPYFKDNYSALYLADSFELMTQFPAGYFDVIFADPPYFLSNGGFSISSLEKKHEFNRQWLRLAKRILKFDGTIWISGTLRATVCELFGLAFGNKAKANFPRIPRI